MDRDYVMELREIAPELLERYRNYEILQFYSDWSEEEWCAGWIIPNKEYIKRAVHWYEEKLREYD